jgi:hypothetical protein
MMSDCSSVEAKSFLSSVLPHHVFVCCNGDVYDSLDSFAKGLSRLSKSDFLFHVNPEKNDFASWVYDCIGDVVLATSLRSCSSKTDLSRKLRSRIVVLKKIMKGA